MREEYSKQKIIGLTGADLEPYLINSRVRPLLPGIISFKIWLQFQAGYDDLALMGTSHGWGGWGGATQDAPWPNKLPGKEVKP